MRPLSAPRRDTTHYFAHHLEASVQQFLGSLVVNGLRTVIHHGIITHQLEVRLQQRKQPIYNNKRPATQLQIENRCKYFNTNICLIEANKYPPFENTINVMNVTIMYSTHIPFPQVIST